MCGISGIVGKDWGRDQLERMVKIQHHRGPDAQAFFWSDDNLTGLGHNRLSIIDLHEEANQPFVSADGRFFLVFNGEIYNYPELRAELELNYPFRTASDTEVLLCAYQQWGTACLDRFIGMFAFAIWDNQDKKLFAARDRFGVKPFNYGTRNGNLYFASEIKALWEAGFPKNPNESVWAGYLVYGTYGMPEQTFWEGILQLPAGHFLEWEAGQITTTRWYDFVGRVKAMPNLSEKAATEQWTAIALESIRLRFRSDVPVGFNLSGGLDSSLLLALVHQLYPQGGAEAFTFFTQDERYDELPWVEEMIQLTRFPLNKVLLRPESVPDLAEKVSWFEDEPFGGIPTLAYSKIFERAREKGVIVLLDGQGMDEAWAGYDYYLKNTGALVQGSHSSPVRPECLVPAFRELAQKPVFPRPFDNDLQNLQYRDLFFTKIPRALRFNDRISMMHSTELREPFLDHRLVELAFSLPESLKIKNGQQKWLARQIADTFLPDKVTLAPKRPLQTPQREWLQADLKPFIEHQLEAYFGAFGEKWLLRDQVFKELKEFTQQRTDNSFFIWQWLSLSWAIEEKINA
ncbi:MAG: asparagine synthase (glutamine-hydrolyzing) [Elusimicrobiota bacterium]